jgi:hypothetical protein
MRPPPARTLGLLALAAFVGGCSAGGCVGFAITPMDGAGPQYARLPHSVAPAPDAAAFRFAMVHDVIHERYPRLGEVYYQARERSAREKLAVLHPESVTALALTDDLAVALDRTGRTDEAVALMRDKLKRQEAAGQTGKDLYSTYANLGEFLVRANLWQMLAGDEAGRARFDEGRDFLRKSVRVNPPAHFGREEWQLVALDTLLEAGANPRVLRLSDLVGNRLDLSIDITTDRWYRAPHAEAQAVYGRPYHDEFLYALDYKMKNDYPDAFNNPNRREEVRRCISLVGGEAPPKNSVDVRRGRRAPFDEPALWLIGEWRQGSGPSPHLALCLGEIMLRVGQRYIAWNCYERAARLADQYAPRADQQQFLRTHCQERQAAIEQSLPAGEVATLRPKFEAELAFGEAYQRDYQAYTEEKLRAGESVDDPHFFDAFHAGREPIASKVGPEEWYAGESHAFNPARKFRALLAWGLLSGGSAVLLTALFIRWRCRPNPLRVTEVTPPPSPAGESPPASSDQSH